MAFFDIDSIFFEVLGYQMSYIEFFGTIAGAVYVVLSARANIWSWPIGIVNVVLFFFLFYQVQLYPDMFLQVFYFVTNFLGWWRWANPKPGEEDRRKELRVSFIGLPRFAGVCVAGLGGTVVLGAFAENLHEWFPKIFGLPSAFPYADSFITVMSMLTTFMMIQKKIESWIIWIVVDALAAYLYYAKGIKFVSLEYLIYCFIAGYGLWHWMQQYYSEKNTFYEAEN
jgi:nicotinamide mononucleotide transporter